jgi:hypothetical protein
MKKLMKFATIAFLALALVTTISCKKDNKEPEVTPEVKKLVSKMTHVGVFSTVERFEYDNQNRLVKATMSHVGDEYEMYVYFQWDENNKLIRRASDDSEGSFLVEYDYEYINGTTIIETGIYSYFDEETQEIVSFEFDPWTYTINNQGQLVNNNDFETYTYNSNGNLSVVKTLQQQCFLRFVLFS